MRLFELNIGLRYLRSRSRNRFISLISLVSVLGLVLGVAVLVVVLSVMNGFQRELRLRILTMTAHGSITGLNRPLADWQDLRRRIAAHPGVVGAAPFISGQSLVVAGNEIEGAAIKGIVPSMENEVSDLSQSMLAGSLSDLQPGDYRVILGADLAQALGVGVGDSVVMMVPQATVTPAGLIPRMRRFTVAGLFRVGMYEYDSSVALMALQDAARLLRLGDDVTGIELVGQDVFAAPQLVREVATDLGGGVLVTDWTRTHPNFFRSIQLTKSIMFMMLLLIVAVAAFNIVSTLVMVVRDKRGDIAILRTLGATPFDILKIFVVQGTAVGVMGVVGGVALGALISVNLESLIHLIEQLLGTKLLAPDVYFISDLPAHMELSDILRISGTALGLGVLSTLYPAWRGARLQPAEVLRYE